MRKVFYSILGLCLLTLVSCQKDSAETTLQKLSGVWKMEKVIDEYYRPVNTLIDSDETPGRDGDAVEFKDNGVVHVYSKIEGDDETTYELLNDNTIKIEDEIYTITKLTSAELNLLQDHTEPGSDERFVQRIYFVR